jgi:hypothetical protein
LNSFCFLQETRRRHRAHSSIPVEAINEEIHPLSIPSSWSRSRSKSPTQRIQPLELVDEDRDEQTRIPRVHSAFIQTTGKKTYSKISEPNLRRSRALNRPKSSNVVSRIFFIVSFYNVFSFSYQRTKHVRRISGQNMSHRVRLVKLR